MEKRNRKDMIVLIVDDEPSVLMALKTAVERGGFQVKTAGDGLVAQQVMSLGQVDAVVSDMKMPNCNGLELSHFVKRTSKAAIILMTGFCEFMDSVDAESMGTHGFLAKPFRKEELLGLLDQALSTSEAPPEPEDLDNKFSKISIDEFVAGKKINYDIFVRISNFKYVKIAHEGDDISIENIKAYKSKNMRYLYLRKDEYKKYVGFTLSLVKSLVNNNSIDIDRKRRFLTFTGDIIMQDLFLNGVDPDSFENSKTFIESTIDLLTGDPSSFSLLEMLNQHSDILYRHSLAVSFYGTMIARAIGWTSPQNTLKIALGGLYHDIGKKELDKELLKKTRAVMTAEEIQAYETHSDRGIKILQELRSFPGDVLQIVLQHHERSNATGFPSRLSKNKIHPLAKLISVSDEFSKLTIKSANSEPMAPTAAIANLTSLYSESLDSTFFEGLRKIFRIKEEAQMASK